MTYYHLPTSTERSPGTLETKLSDGAQLGPPETGWTKELAALCGFVEIINTTRPADTATNTSTRSLTRVGNTVTEVWTIVPKTAEQLTSETEQANRSIIESRVNALITQLNTLASTTGTLTGAQLSDGLRVVAIGLRAVVRFQFNKTSTAD